MENQRIISMETVTLKPGEGSRKTRTSEHQIYGGSNSGNGDRESSDIVERFGVFTKAELESRAEIQYESYAKAINIEARTMIDMARKQFIPAVIKYTKTLADTVLAVKEAGVDASVQAETLEEITVLLKEARAALARLEEVTAQAAAKEEGPVQANFYHDEVCPAMENLRRPIDKLEMIVDKEAWPMPSYGDLIFEV